MRGCHQEKQVDYCYQCPEFPCSNTHFDERLQEVRVVINEKIRKAGIEKYYEAAKDRSRYP